MELILLFVLIAVVGVVIGVSVGLVQTRRRGDRTGLEPPPAAVPEAVKQEAAEMMRTYLGEDPDALDGFEFLTMAEAGEAGHWSIVKTMAERAGDRQTLQLAEWAVPIQERHLQEAQQGSLRLAEQEDPTAPE